VRGNATVFSGKYKTTTVNLPVVSLVKGEAADNIGLGFWTQQNQGAPYLYPWADQRMAVQNALTWELHREKRDFDLTPGRNLTWNWGVSQFLPLKKDKTVLLEVGPSGYGSFQLSEGFEKGKDVFPLFRALGKREEFHMKSLLKFRLCPKDPC
jgi:hypothetical protein